MISAIASCVSGYLLSDSGDYDEDLVNRHQWLGIAVAFIAMIFYLLRNKEIVTKTKWLLPVLLIVLISLTGHLGGTLTHGEGYLTNAFNAAPDNNANLIRKPIPDVQEAIAYKDIIQPLLQSKCYNCHGAKKQKGKLRMDQPELLMKGGKDGVVIEAGNADKSELIKRILLAREAEHHMPPKEKPQLNEKEIALLHWWIAGGASFVKKTKELPQPEKIKPVLLALQHAAVVKKPDTSIPVTPVEKADEAATKKLKDAGAVIMPVAVNSNYLLANFVASAGITDKDLQLLLPIRKQLVWLKLGNTNITDGGLAIIAQCENLTKLQLDYTGITDNGMESIASLQLLQSLNLVGTKVTAAGVLKLAALKKLQSVYLYQTAVENTEWETLKKKFPAVNLDSGGYKVPIFNTDTELVKPPKIQ
jgi:mono/diheme cytochrome c family protein